MGGALLVGGALALVVGATLLTRVSRVALFWIAFVLTRPLGATVGDVLTTPKEKGALDFGTVGSSATLLTILVALVVASMVKQKRARGEAH